jgi:hypothetical protein
MVRIWSKTSAFPAWTVWVRFGMPSRYGTGELYGFDFGKLPAERIRELASAPYKSLVCPFKPLQPGKLVSKCNKKGGVCSLRLFEQDEKGGVVGKGEPVTTCPSRFLEDHLVNAEAGALRWCTLEF